jgi:hypothetical protein
MQAGSPPRRPTDAEETLAENGLRILAFAMRQPAGTGMGEELEQELRKWIVRRTLRRGPRIASRRATP